MVKSLVVRASKLRIDLLAELACVRGGNVFVEGFLILPDLDNRDVISALASTRTTPLSLRVSVTYCWTNFVPAAASGGMMSTCDTT